MGDSPCLLNTIARIAHVFENELRNSDFARLANRYPCHVDRENLIVHHDAELDAISVARCCQLAAPILGGVLPALDRFDQLRDVFGLSFQDAERDKDLRRVQRSLR